MMAVNRLKTKKRTTAKRTDTIRVCGLPSFNRNAIHQLTSNSWFGNIGNILHIDVKSNDNVHIAEITFSSKKEAQSALRWVHQYNCGSKAKAQRTLQAHYTQTTSQSSVNILLKEHQALLESSKQKNQLLHQIIERLQVNLHHNKEKQDALRAQNKKFQDELQNIKMQQQILQTKTSQMNETIKSIRSDNNRLEQVHAILQTNYGVMQQQTNAILRERQRMIHYCVATEWYANVQRMSTGKGVLIQAQAMGHTVAPYSPSPSPPSLTEEPVDQTMEYMADNFDWLTVCHWIVRIQGGIFMKYVNELSTALRDRRIGFNDLYQMNGDDLRMIGITEWKDVMLLCSEIQKLRLSHSHVQVYET